MSKRRTAKEIKVLNAAQQAASTLENSALAGLYVYALERKTKYNDTTYLDFMKELEQAPVSIETFLDSEDFIGATDLTLWPAVREAIININKDWWRGPSYAVREAVLTGGLGIGKSEIGRVTTLYHLHILGCLKVPQRLYSLPQSTSIVFTVQSAKPHVTKKVLYAPLRAYVETMPWFNRHLRPNKLIESEMYFEQKNIRVVPVGSDADAILGEAIIGAIVDEMNFMSVVENSKKSAEMAGGRAGRYDQAQSIYDTVTRRRKSRFIYTGPYIGVILCCSSTRYRNDFTSRRIQYVQENNEKGVYIYNKAQYEAKPPETFCGDVFRVSVENDAATDIRILEDSEPVYSAATNVVEVPVEYLEDFRKDAIGALRDIVGMSVNSVNPFFRNRIKLGQAVEKGEESGLRSILVRDNVNLSDHGMPRVKKDKHCKDPAKPRYVHIDLSVTGDRCGIAMVRYDGMVDVSRETGEREELPLCSVEIACSIQPDHNEEIDVYEVRTWVQQLKSIYGYPIRSVTYDSFGSLESRQQWKRQGMMTGHVSVDRTTVPYRQFRDAIYDGRILLYNNPDLLQELYDLEHDEKKDKVDHPSVTGASKDIADAVCAAYHVLLTRSSSWADIMPEADTQSRYESPRASYDART